MRALAIALALVTSTTLLAGCTRPQESVEEPGATAREMTLDVDIPEGMTHLELDVRVASAEGATVNVTVTMNGTAAVNETFTVADGTDTRTIQLPVDGAREATVTVVVAMGDAKVDVEVRGVRPEGPSETLARDEIDSRDG